MCTVFLLFYLQTSDCISCPGVSGVFADAFSSAGGDSYAAASCGNPSLAAAVFADLRYKLFSR